MVCIESAIGPVSIPGMATNLFGTPRELVGYCVYHRGRLLFREAHPLDDHSIRLDVELERVVSKDEAERHIKMALATYLKERSAGKSEEGLRALKPTLERWGLQSLVEASASIPGYALYKQTFDPMIGYSAFTRGLAFLGQERALQQNDVKNGEVSLFRHEPLPENEQFADFRGHLYLARNQGALMVNDAVISNDHWVLPYLHSISDVDLRMVNPRSAKARPPALLAGCKVMLCDRYVMSMNGQREASVSDFPLRTRLHSRDTLILTPSQPGDAESIALQFLSVDDLDAGDLQCFNDTVVVVNQWLDKLRRAEQLFTVIK